MQVNSVPYVWENVSCRELVNEAIMYSMNIYTQPLYQGHQNRPRGADAFLLLATGKAVPSRWTITNPNTEVRTLQGHGGGGGMGGGGQHQPP